MKRLILLTGACALTLVSYAQTPDKDPYPGYNHNFTPDWSLMKLPTATAGGIGVRLFPNPSQGELPDHWNTGDQIYFPPIYNQWGGSCGVASHVGYVVTTEMNSYQNTNAKLIENQLAPNFEYAFTYNGPGKEEMAIDVGFPSVEMYGGRTVSSIYGAYECNTTDFAWVQGYDIFYNAMHHRISHLSNFPLNVGTPEGMAAVKWYLYNHAGDPRFGGRGGAVGIGAGAGASAHTPIPHSPNNDKYGFSGKRYMLHWNIGNVDHALCIVGYDDRVEFDLDNNGKVGEARNEFGENEKGAWIVANTWGTGWANGGFVYVPYAQAGPTAYERTSQTTGKKSYGANGFWSPNVYFYRCGYKPMRTIKATMSYVGRSEISVKVGIAQDLKADKPEKTYQFAYINYTGDSKNGRNSDIFVPTPMLGRWADGKLHYEPMEFGIDVTDLTSEFDSRKPLKYFLIVNTKKSAKGYGGIHKASVMDYEFNKAGSEVPFMISGDSVTIKNGGATTIISTIMPGEALEPPYNVNLVGDELQWQAPVTVYTPKAYTVYRDNQPIATVTSTSYRLTPAELLQPKATAGTAGVYTVEAVYDINGEDHTSVRSNTAAPKMTLDEMFDNKVVAFQQNGFTIPAIAKTPNPEYTIEFWIKPTKLDNWNQTICNSWGSFMIHTDATGALSAGWDNGGANRIDVLNALAVNSWRHVAVVVDHNRLTVYINGVKKGETTSNNHNGFPALGDLVFGNGADKDKLSAVLDEVRIWNVARSGILIRQSMKTPVADPSAMPGLLAYFKMDTFEQGGVTYLRDCAGGHNAPIMNSHWKPETVGNRITLSRTGMRQVLANLRTPQDVMVNVPQRMELRPSVNAYNYKWTAENATPATSTLANPVFVFKKPGKAKVEVEVSDITGTYHNSNSVEVDVAAAPAATANFNMTAESVPGGMPISFVALNQAPGCRYDWSMPGAVDETSCTMVATAVYRSSGEKTVTLKVTTPDGEELTSSKTITVLETQPAAAYSVTPHVVVKGQPVTLQDKSLYEPTAAVWRFYSDNAQIATTGLQAQIVPERAGVYDLAYIASNDLGSSPVVGHRVLAVCNADSKHGLMINGGLRHVSVDLPALTESAFTLEYWLNPLSLDENANGIYLFNDSVRFSISSGENGDVTLQLGDKKAICRHFYIRNEWHHYAITVSQYGTVTFYRDGQVLPREGATLDRKNYSEILRHLQIGARQDGEALSTASYDEFRLWNKSLAINEIRQVAVAPLEGEALTEAKSKGLVLYFPFNQNSGNVLDVVSGKNIGIRSANFGPDGDAWIISSGVFALDFSPKQYANARQMGEKLDRSSYRLMQVSDEELSRELKPADYALDNDDFTFWHSKYDGGEHGFPHTFTFARANRDEIVGMQAYIKRADNYRPSEMSVEVSKDGEVWRLVDFNLDLYNRNQLTVQFTEPITAPFFRINFTKSMQNSNLMSMEELRFFGRPAAEPAVPLSLNFVSASSKNGNNGGGNALDGNASTFWETAAAKNYPHEIVLQVNDDKAFDLMHLQFVGGKTASRADLYVSNNKSSWTKLETNLRIPLYADNLIRLSEPIKAKYVKVVFTQNGTFRNTGSIALKELQLLTSEWLTGIDEVRWDADKLQAPGRLIYDLGGRCYGTDAQHLPAGVYVRGGQKIMIP